MKPRAKDQAITDGRAQATRPIPLAEQVGIVAEQLRLVVRQEAKARERLAEVTARRVALEREHAELFQSLVRARKDEKFRQQYARPGARAREER